MSGSTLQNHEIRYTLLKSQLKNFFLIDTDKIALKISEELKELENQKESKSASKQRKPDRLRHANTITTEEAFSVIFNNIFSCASLYCDFLDPYTHNGFFSEHNNHSPELQGLRRLLYFTLQNNCIVNAFFHQLATISKDMDVSAATEKFVTHDILEKITDSNYNHPELRNLADSPFWYSRKNIFQKECRMHPTSYNCAILNALLNIYYTSTKTTYKCKQFLAPLSSFLFSTDSCTKFSRSLSDKSISFKSYNRICKDFIDNQSLYKEVIDKLIFESEIESCFGFSFFSYIASDINTIHISSPEENHSAKKLEGETLYGIIAQVSNLPLYYNKSLFFKYIHSVFTFCDDINDSYFTHQAQSMMIQVPNSLREEMQAIITLELGQKFIQLLSTVTIPLLYSLWDTVTYELGKTNADYIFTIEKYADFLSDHYAQVSSCYASIDIERIKQCEDPKKILLMSKDNIYDYFPKELFKKELFKKEEVTGKEEVSCIDPSTIQKPLVETVSQLIQSYCDFSAFEKRVPLFTTPDANLNSYSLLSPLIDAIVNPASSKNGMEPLASKEFKLQHQRGILEYVIKD